MPNSICAVFHNPFEIAFFCPGLRYRTNAFIGRLPPIVNLLAAISCTFKNPRVHPSLVPTRLFRFIRRFSSGSARKITSSGASLGGGISHNTYIDGKPGDFQYKMEILGEKG